MPTTLPIRLPATLLLLLAVAMTSCGGARTAQGTTPLPPVEDTPPPVIQQIAPAEVAAALVALSSQMQQQVQAAADEIERLQPGNETRRRTLRWRIRMAEVCTQARWRDNALAGVVELWFWTLAAERHFTAGEGARHFAAHRQLLLDRIHALQGTAERLLRRCVPSERVVGLKARLMSTVDGGDAFIADSHSAANPLGNLLEASRLESLLSIPLSPFGAFEGVKAGGDAAAHLSVVAERAVDLLETYPRLIDWHLQAALVEVQAQDGVAGLLREVAQANATIAELQTTVRTMPAQLRTEAVALLEQSRPAQGDVRETLASATRTAEALEKLSTAVDALLARVLPPPGSTPPPHEGPPARPFDIREYTAALEAGAVVARDLRATLASAEQLLAAPAIPARVAEVDRSLHTLVAAIAGWSIAVLLVLTACVVVVIRTIRRGAKTT